MEYKYPEGLKFTTQEDTRIWTFEKGSDNQISYLEKGLFVTLRHHIGEKYPYYVEYDNVQSDWFSEKALEKLIGNQHISQCIKPPLGLTPKNIFEYQRVKDIIRALNDYIDVDPLDYELLTKWAEELEERLINLKYSDE